MMIRLPYSPHDVVRMHAKGRGTSKRWTVFLRDGTSHEVDHDTAGDTFRMARHLTEANIETDGDDD